MCIKKKKAGIETRNFCSTSSQSFVLFTFYSLRLSSSRLPNYFFVCTDVIWLGSAVKSQRGPCGCSDDHGANTAGGSRRAWRQISVLCLETRTTVDDRDAGIIACRKTSVFLHMCESECDFSAVCVAISLSTWCKTILLWVCTCTTYTACTSHFLMSLHLG